MTQDIGASAKPTRLSSLRDRAAAGVSPVPASIPSAVIERLDKFALEWGVMMARSRMDNEICALHVGDARYAVLRHDDLCAILSYASAIEARSGDTHQGLDPKDESAVGNAETLKDARHD